jgi:hypothetical protein
LANLFLLKKLFPVIAGAALGFSYYYFIGCKTGSCPITGNPWISTTYGALTGFIISIPSQKKKDDSKTN